MKNQGLPHEGPFGNSYTCSSFPVVRRTGCGGIQHFQCRGLYNHLWVSEVISLKSSGPLLPPTLKPQNPNLFFGGVEKTPPSSTISFLLRAFFRLWSPFVHKPHFFLSQPPPTILLPGFSSLGFDVLRVRLRPRKCFQGFSLWCFSPPFLHFPGFLRTPVRWVPTAWFLITPPAQPPFLAPQTTPRTRYLAEPENPTLSLLRPHHRRKMSIACVLMVHPLFVSHHETPNAKAGLG